MGIFSNVFLFFGEYPSNVSKYNRVLSCYIKEMPWHARSHEVFNKWITTPPTYTQTFHKLTKSFIFIHTQQDLEVNENIIMSSGILLAAHKNLDFSCLCVHMKPGNDVYQIHLKIRGELREIWLSDHGSVVHQVITKWVRKYRQYREEATKKQVT